MRKLLSVLVLLAFVAGTSVGCASSGGVGTGLGSDDVSKLIVKNEEQITTGALIATTTIVLTMDPKDQVGFATTAYKTAEAVHKAVGDESISLAGVRELAAGVIARSEFKHKAAAGYLFQAVTQLVENRLATGGFKDIPPESRVAAARALLRGASKGVMQATVFMLPPGTAEPMSNSGDVEWQGLEKQMAEPALSRRDTYWLRPQRLDKVVG